VERWTATLLGSVGDFGVGPDFTWQSLAGIGYDIDETWFLKAGYRALGVDYKNGTFRLDAIIHGPVVGVGIRF
jgi:opacity protein-like surface antigen